MTDNQEKELFLTLGKLVSGVSGMQVDLREMKDTLAQHTLKLDKLESKIDSVAGQVIVNDKRVSSRIDGLEQAIEDLGGKVH